MTSVWAGAEEPRQVDPATTRETRIAGIRNETIRRVVGYLVRGRPQVALATLTVSVEEQARLAGCGEVHLTVVEP